MPSGDSDISERFKNVAKNIPKINMIFFLGDTLNISMLEPFRLHQLERSNFYKAPISERKCEKRGEWRYTASPETV